MKEMLNLGAVLYSSNIDIQDLDLFILIHFYVYNCYY